MQGIYGRNSHAYIIVSNLYVKEVTVLKDSGDLCTVRFEGGGGTRLHRSRLYRTEEDARQWLNERKRRRASSYFLSRTR